MSQLLAELQKQRDSHKKQRDLHERLSGIYEDALDQAQKAYDEAGVTISASAENGEVEVASTPSKRSIAMKAAWARRRSEAKAKTKTKAKPKPKSKNVDDTPRRRGRRSQNKEPLSEIVRGILAKKSNIEGLKLGDLVEQVVNSGWKTSSKREDAMTQMVYQATRKLKDEDGVVVKDEDSKRYKLKNHPAAA